ALEAALPDLELEGRVAAHARRRGGRGDLGGVVARDERVDRDALADAAFGEELGEAQAARPRGEVEERGLERGARERRARERGCSGERPRGGGERRRARVEFAAEEHRRSLGEGTLRPVERLAGKAREGARLAEAAQTAARGKLDEDARARLDAVARRRE